MTAIEFALVAPVIVLILIGTIEFALIMFVTSVMESATNTTARMGKTGYVEAGNSREDQIVENITEMTAGLLKPTKIIIDTKVYPMLDDIGTEEPYTDSNGNGTYNVGETYSDVNGNGQWDADMASAGAGDANDIVVYEVRYDWPISTPIMQQYLGGTFRINVRTVVKNEPYNVQM